MQRWNLPDGWVISRRPAHEALVSEADVIAAQDVSARRGPVARSEVGLPVQRRYLLSGLLTCGTCGRRMESAWSNGKAAYRCRRGSTMASAPDLAQPRNAYVREDRILPHLPAPHLLLIGTAGERHRRRTRNGVDTRCQAMPEVTPLVLAAEFSLDSDAPSRRPTVPAPVASTRPKVTICMHAARASSPLLSTKGCDKKGGFHAERHEMRTRHSPGITRRAAERLLDGATGSGPEHLSQVLSAAAASAREGELAGERTALAAFEASPPFEARPLSHAVTPRKRKMPNLPLVNLISVKVVAWSLAGLVAAGGAATAGTVAFSGSGSTSTGNAGAAAAGQVQGTSPGATAPGNVSTPANSSASTGSSDASALTPVQLCTELTTRVQSTLGDAVGTADKAALASVLANPAVSQVLSTPPVSALLTTVGNATAVPDYCGLVLALPTVPMPNAFTQLPASVLNQALSALPATDLAGVLNSLPTDELSQTLGELSPTQLSSVFTTLSPGAAGSVLSTLPASSLGNVLTTLPASTVTSLLPGLPTGDLTQVLTTLPNAATGTVLSELPATDLTQVLTALPSSALGNVFTGLPTSDLGEMLTALPSSALGNVLTALPAPTLGSVLTQLPAGNLSRVLSTLPTSGLSGVLGALPAGDLSSVLTTLPSSTVGSLMGSLPSSTASQILGKLPASVLNGLRGVLPPSILSPLPL
jgi:hypothetical protein